MSAAAAVGIGMFLPSDAMAQRGRGGGGMSAAAGRVGGGGGGMSAAARGGGGFGGGGGGGARPSMGMVGGGGARTNMPSMPTARPNYSNLSRPSGPSFGNTNARPSMPSAGSMNRGGIRGGQGAGGSSIGANRPSLGGTGNLSNVTRPAATLPGASRPATLPSVGGGNLPSLGAGNRPDGSNRPSLGNVNRPATLPGGINRPGSGVERPSLGGNRPTTLPGSVQRPGEGATLPGIGGNRPATLPGTLPSTRPSLPNTRPGTLPGTLPGGGERPGLGANRPGVGGGIPGVGGNRPVTLPGVIDPPGAGGNRPGIGGNRPGIGGNRPGEGGNIPGVGGQRPVTLPGVVERPGIGGNRPGIGGNRPGGDINLPGSGNNNNVIVNRPGINVGGGNNIGNNVGNNIGNNIGNRYPNRPNWDNDLAWNRPGWGMGGSWNNNWNNNIGNRYPWYNGAWNGNWGSNWVAPVLVGWGLNSLVTGWGTNAVFYNPYVVQPIAGQSVPFDFSQPVVVNNFITSETSSSESVAKNTTADSANQLGLDAFERGLAKFKEASFRDALSEFNLALTKLPGDPVVHEVRALTLFATGDFKGAAANLSALLASSPGMDWTTMSGLYGDIGLYTDQLRKLEEFTKANPSDAASHFVLAYHYLVMDADEAAITALKVVVANQPKDVVARRMLDALVPPATATASTPTTVAPAPANSTTPAAAAPETDLVGSWVAQAKDTKIELAITEDSKFQWTATTKQEPPVVLKGVLTSHSDGLELTNPDQGTIAGGVTSNGLNSWNFMISGSPPDDPGLKFTRIN